MSRLLSRNIVTTAVWFILAMLLWASSGGSSWHLPHHSWPPLTGVSVRSEGPTVAVMKVTYTSLSANTPVHYRYRTGSAAWTTASFNLDGTSPDSHTITSVPRLITGSYSTASVFASELLHHADYHFHAFRHDSIDDRRAGRRDVGNHEFG